MTNVFATAFQILKRDHFEQHQMSKTNLEIHIKQQWIGEIKLTIQCYLCWHNFPKFAIQLVEFPWESVLDVISGSSLYIQLLATVKQTVKYNCSNSRTNVSCSTSVKLKWFDILSDFVLTAYGISHFHLHQVFPAPDETQFPQTKLLGHISSFGKKLFSAA